MRVFSAAILAVLACCVPTRAQLQGVWAAPSAVDSLEQNRYRYVLFSDLPPLAFVEEMGRYSIHADSVALMSADGLSPGPRSFRLSAAQDSLLPTKTVAALTRITPARWDLLEGNWDFVDGQDRSTKHIQFDDGRYVSDVGGGQAGLYRVAGNALVLWADTAGDAGLIGEPGLWFDVEIEAGSLRFRLGERLVGQARRRPATMELQHHTWPQIRRLN